VKLGYPETVIIGLGVVLLTCTVIYLIPRTAVVGAILLTRYLGGAVATHVAQHTDSSAILGSRRRRLSITNG
jgi:fucose permease